MLSCECETDTHTEFCAVGELDRQSLAGGMHSAGKSRGKIKYKTQNFGVGLENDTERETAGRFGDSGGASRFFYVAKASTSEKNRGLENQTEQTVDDGREKSIDNPFQRGETLRKNSHPTVKPIRLMRYLCRLITPPGGTILDPFLGSGSTGIAAKEEGFEFIGIEKEKEYFDIAQCRINVL